MNRLKYLTNKNIRAIKKINNTEIIVINYIDKKLKFKTINNNSKIVIHVTSTITETS